MSNPLSFAFQSLSVLSLHPDPAQPRKKFSEQADKDLEESMRVHGMLQTILVREEDGKFIIVNGERRWKRASNLGWEKVDCLVTTADSKHALVLQLIENVQREDLSPEDLANHLLALKSQHEAEDRKSTLRILAAMIGKSVGWVSEKLTLADMPAEVRALKDSSTVKNSRVLIGLTRLQAKNPEAAGALIKEIEAGKKVTPELISQVSGSQRAKRKTQEEAKFDELPSRATSPETGISPVEPTVPSAVGQASAAEELPVVSAAAPRPDETQNKPRRKRKVTDVAKLIGVPDDLPAEELLERLADAYAALIAERDAVVA